MFSSTSKTLIIKERIQPDKGPSESGCVKMLPSFKIKKLELVPSIGSLSELSNNNSSKFFLFFSNEANTYKFALEDFIVDSKLLDLRCLS